jgi:hypothetical protein
LNNIDEFHYQNLSNQWLCVIYLFTSEYVQMVNVYLFTSEYVPFLIIV